MVQCNVNINTLRELLFQFLVVKFFSSKLVVGSTSGDLECQEKPENSISSIRKPKKPEEIVDDFDPTQNGEACQKAHCASYKAQLGLHCHLEIISLVCF